MKGPTFKEIWEQTPLFMRLSWVFTLVFGMTMAGLVIAALIKFILS